MTTESTLELVPQQQQPSAITARSMAAEMTVRQDLGKYVPAVLKRKGSVVKIQGGSHVTNVALTEIAGLLGVSVEFSEPEWGDDPVNAGKRAVLVKCRAIRADGVVSESYGFCSNAETVGRQNKPRWTDAFAQLSMAQTRARVRALNAMLMPVLQTHGVSATPAEDMPNSAGREEPIDADAEPVVEFNAGKFKAGIKGQLAERGWDVEAEDADAVLNAITQKRSEGMALTDISEIIKSVEAFEDKDQWWTKLAGDFA